MNNFFIDQFGTFDYKHANSILVTTLLMHLKTLMIRKWQFISVKDILNYCYPKSEVVIFNSFDYQTPEDFIYYVLFTAEQLSLNPENFPLELIGNIDSESDFFKIAYKYIRNVSLWTSTIYDGTIIFLRPKTEIILYFSTHENHFRKIQGKTYISQKAYQFAPLQICLRKHYSM
jgi:hypothetical protein